MTQDISEHVADAEETLQQPHAPTNIQTTHSMSHGPEHGTVATQHPGGTAETPSGVAPQNGVVTDSPATGREGMAPASEARATRIEPMQAGYDVASGLASAPSPAAPEAAQRILDPEPTASPTPQAVPTGEPSMTGRPEEAMAATGPQAHAESAAALPTAASSAPTETAPTHAPAAAGQAHAAPAAPAATSMPTQAPAAPGVQAAEASRAPAESAGQTEAGQARSRERRPRRPQPSGPPRLPLDQLTPGTMVKGTVKNIAQFGAFIDIGAEQDGLVHISELSEGRVRRVEDVVKPGQEVEVTVLNVDMDRRRISLSMKPRYDIRDEYKSQDEERDENLSPMAAAFQRAREKQRQARDSQARDAAKQRQQQEDILSRTLRQHKDRK